MIFKTLDVAAEMFEDYITVCGHTSNDTKGEGKEAVQPVNSKPNKKRNVGNNGEDVENDANSNQLTQSLVFVAKCEDLCDVKLYFSREIRENRCPSAHEVAVHAVLDKKAKISRKRAQRVWLGARSSKNQDSNTP